MTLTVIEDAMQLYLLPGMRGLAADYSSGAYGQGVYSCTGTCTTTDNSGSNLLVNTGIAVGLFVGLAALLLLVVMVVRFWRRPARPKPQQPADAQKPEDPQRPHDPQNPAN